MQTAEHFNLSILIGCFVWKTINSLQIIRHVFIIFHFILDALLNHFETYHKMQIVFLTKHPIPWDYLFFSKLIFGWQGSGLKGA